MRPLRTTLCVLSLACALPAVSLAGDFTDFRIPTQDWRQWNANASAGFAGHSQNAAGDASRFHDLGGGLGAGWDRFHDSDRWQWRIRVSGGLSGDHSNSSRDERTEFPPPSPATFDQHSRDHDRSVHEFWSAGAGMRGYPWAVPVGWDVSASVDGRTDQAWTDDFEDRTFASGSVSHDESSSELDAWHYAESATITGSLGYGRVRDATPVFQIILLEERLRRDGVLTRELARGTRQKIAELYAIRGSFAVVHDQSDKFFWRELERLLREDGALRESGLDAYAVRHADDALVVARGFYRPVGFFFGPTLSAFHRHDVLRRSTSDRTVFFVDSVPLADLSTSSSQRQRSFSDRTEYGLTAEYDVPLGDRTQIRAYENFSTELSSDPHDLRANGLVACERLVGERWFARVSVQHQRELVSEIDAGRWDIAAQTSLDYYLEDHLTVSFDVQKNWDADHGPIFSDRRQDYVASIRLRLHGGRLDAPGLIAPQRPLD